VETALCLTPGPAVLFVVSHGLSRGGRAALAANAGILTANTIYFILSALGLGAVLLASHQVFIALKYAGGIYLVYLGVRTIAGAGLALSAPRETTAGAAQRAWLRAAALQLANPKALVFFAALLPQFLDAARPIAPQMLILAVTSAVIEFLVLASYGYLAASASRLAHQPRFRTITNRVSGSLLIVAGAGVAIGRNG
jgi:homoserine/homoserine lactone efflux protein